MLIIHHKLFFTIIRPHDSYCVRRCGLLSLTEYCGLSVTVVSPAKTAEPIEMPFGLRILVGPRNHVLDRGQHPPMGRGNFEGRGGPL